MSTSLNAYNFYKDHIQHDKHYKYLYDTLCTLSERNGHLHPQTTLREMFYKNYSKDFQKQPKEYEIVRNGQKRIAQLMYEFLLKQARDLSEELKKKNMSKGVFITGIQIVDMNNSIYSVDYHGIPLVFSEHSTTGSYYDPPEYDLIMTFPPADHLLSYLEEDIIESFPNENIYDLPRSKEFTEAMELQQKELKKLTDEQLMMHNPYGESFLPDNLQQIQDAFLQASYYIKDKQDKLMEQEM